MPNEGLYQKYGPITKANGSPTPPEAQYFVLRIDNDSDALHAAMVYALLKDNFTLMADLHLQGVKNQIVRPMIEEE